MVAVCATGDELVADGAELARGQLYESNSHVLAGALRRDGARVIRLGGHGSRHHPATEYGEI